MVAARPPATEAGVRAPSDLKGSYSMLLPISLFSLSSMLVYDPTYSTFSFLLPVQLSTSAHLMGVVMIKYYTAPYWSVASAQAPSACSLPGTCPGTPEPPRVQG